MVDGFLVRHNKTLRIIALCAIGIGTFCLFMVALFDATTDKSRYERNAEILKKEISLGLIQPTLLADNINPGLRSEMDNAQTRTLIYLVNDTECGFALYLVTTPASLSQRASISGERIPGINASSPAGFKQIGGSIGDNLEQTPQVYRYVDLKRERVIYYLDWYSSSCNFDLFEART
ncbi:MAG TPA: hypothetical protein P5080_05305 [Candidatus Paceibacterota bacterium]|nr:hypothetical protein [Candidatus Pacearchaeota archaeon]HRZ51364.1 hypothetical protein [Candidatus Paceibacterota bacterium]HSA37086.1 hypothetical protein [Candidatus Paceibacterota bacterium]